MSVLRPYQHHAVEAVFREWEKVTSTMISIFTGGGKTRIFSEIIKRVYPKRSLVIAHHTELIHQAAKHVRDCGLEVEIEKAELKASSNMFSGAPVVVAAIQTLVSGKIKKRMEKFKPNDFGVLVIDECHHGVSDSWKSVIDYFKQNPDLKVFGCTATPDRSDEKALGRIIDTVAYRYEILDGINDGWLVPVEQLMIRVGSLDFSHVRTTAGDLNGADLAAVMEQEENPQKIAGAAGEIIGKRRTIIFACRVEHARLLTEIINRPEFTKLYGTGPAACISGSTPSEERKLILKDFDDGRIQILVNVGVFTEGVDLPKAEIALIARPTKSRSLYTQMCGRIMRPLTGILDGAHSAYERKQVIADSPKPRCIVVDLTCNSGNHKLITTADILGGKYSDEVKEQAKKKAVKAKGPVNMQRLLEESEEVIRERMEKARLAEEARKAKLVARVQYSSRVVNPFDNTDRTDFYRPTRNGGRILSEKQRQLLVKMQVNPDTVSYIEGVQMIAEKMAHWKGTTPATEKQVSLLSKHGYATEKMTVGEASKLIDALAQNNWQRPHLKPE